MKQIFKSNETEKLKKIIEAKKVVVAGGCFDIVHLGHLIFLEKAKKRGNFLIVFLESDESIRKNKGDKRPINNQENRAIFLTKLKMVDAVVCLRDRSDYVGILGKIRPKIVAVTEGDPNFKTKTEMAKTVGAKVTEVSPLIPFQSTSRVVEIIGQLE